VTDPIRVLIVDDHRLFSQALELLLRGEESIKVVGSAATGEEALEMCSTTAVDVALVDIDLPGMDGIAVTSRLLASHPDIRVVVITAFQQPNVIARAVRAGASGYVMKTDLSDTLVAAIGMAMSGNMVLPAGRLAPSASSLAQWNGPEEVEARTPPRSTGAAERSAGPLSEREIEILQALAGGWTTQEVADNLAISAHTVRTHVKHILAKLEARSKAEAVSKGVRLGLISTAPSSEPAAED
jgi:DNA-binding NarL/FixJ family response regulator